MKKNPVVHFEMPAEDKKRMSDFYTNVFGWETQMMGEEYGGYVIAITTESDPKTGPIKPGAINGGFYQKTEDKLSQYPSIVIQVDDIKAHMKMVEEAGGKISGKMEDIPGVGLWASIIDTEGNRISMMQSHKK